MRDELGNHFTLGEARRTELTEVDVILLRQDPPFDLAYITTTHLLERVHPKTFVVNNPASVRNAPEKVFVTRISRPDAADADHARPRGDQGVPRRARRHRDEAALRPRRRRGVPVTRDDLNFGSLYDLFAVTFREQWVVQALLPAVKDGDKRIILVDGEYAGAVNRVPAADDLRSNMVRGGSPKETELTPREREICQRLGPHLRERGLLLVGIDVIGGWLTEINVTSPTGIRAVKQCRRAGCREDGVGQDRGEAEGLID